MKSEDERHNRLMRQIPFLRAGFRPFFLGGAIWAVTVVSLWVLTLAGKITLPSAFDPLAWHRHEMLFGYLGGVVAGFLLTAIPNWTGQLPVNGKGLAGLAALWFAARIVVLGSAMTGVVPAAALDVGFLATMTFVAAREIPVVRNHNVAVVVTMAVFTLADAVDYGELMGLGVPAGLGWRLGFAIVLLLVSLIGGRIIPSFTRNWLGKQGQTKGLPAQPSGFDHMTVALTAIALLSWAISPDRTFSGALLVGVGALHTVRLARWSGWRTWREPLVLILHLSYAWLPLGLLLLGGRLFIWCIPYSSALHALSAGAMASMTLAVMTRATLGHTGRDLHAGMATTSIYVLLTLGAIVRFAAPMLPFDYISTITTAGVLWGGAFLVFVATYGVSLIGPRPDGRP